MDRVLIKHEYLAHPKSWQPLCLFCYVNICVYLSASFLHTQKHLHRFLIISLSLEQLLHLCACWRTSICASQPVSVIIGDCVFVRTWVVCVYFLSVFANKLQKKCAHKVQLKQQLLIIFVFYWIYWVITIMKKSFLTFLPAPVSVFAAKLHQSPLCGETGEIS